ncbi:MAG: ABC transporter ATP-binding protein/permease [Bifidobacteriaceae bacterium]|jgi:ABC-type multidrug transport system fused ATPase/permease subunit|nr:ABC transporter ATP-binding protein/permease [Bifidobacteriaceae bacterium]
MTPPAPSSPSALGSPPAPNCPPAPLAAAAPSAAAATDPAAPLSEAAIRRRLLSLARPILKPLGLSILFRIIGLATGIALLGLAGWAVLGAQEAQAAWLAGGLATPRPTTLAPTSQIIWALVALALVKGLARYLEQYCGHYVAFRALAQLRLYFYDKLAPQAPAAVEGRDTGDLLARVTKDVDRVEVFFAHTLAPAVTAVIVPLATVIYVGTAVSPWAVAPLTAGLALVGLVTPALRRASSAKASLQIRAARGALASHARDSVQGVREVLAFDYQERRLASLDQLGRPLSRALRSLGDTIALRRGLNVAIIAATAVAELIVLAAAGVSPAALGLGLGITVSAFAPVIAVEDFAADLQQAYASARRVFEVTDTPPLVPDRAAAPPPHDPDRPSPPARPAPVGAPSQEQEDRAGPVLGGGPLVSEGRAGAAGPVLGGGDPLVSEGRAGAARSASGDGAPEVRFEGVTFRYPGAARGAAALTAVSLTAAAGRVTAIVGASGSGKSTLAALLTRSWDPDEGAITLDGRRLDAWPLARLRSLVAVAPQRPYLFNQSIRENLLLARPGASEADLAWAAHAAHLDAVIASKEAGWDAPVGELGELLSGGERQRLALARTLLRRPAVLVVDEATSQLDQEAEAEVLAGLRRAAEGRTVLVIAHRLATVRDADAVHVMDAGRVVQSGTYADLAGRPGPFADLLARERSGGEPDLAA